ncbi:fatty acid desaturase family protein [Segnochrobactrum spirostomi]|uniref:Fatty acid desaturase n=1 Tax=Segnochrobactrum spirostomi TaxID=2608987 RepID=A0A6A7Y4C8_9HYPH|nr:fatty acid desaturase family protein [Segnochrobactrum spirostomi]MQT13585.1 fatty acid desaturase [Segnochrobactrum spirostomi]
MGFEPSAAPPRDYSLVGPETARALERGLATAEWYTCPIPRKDMKALMKRSDGPALRDTAIWLGALVVSGVLGGLAWGTWLAVPCFLVYGVLYGSVSDSRWHECGHGTAFKTRWLNDAVYHLACFMILREPTIWRWSHTRHHTDTIIVGRDPEIAVPRPPDFLGLLLNLFALKSAAIALPKLFLHATGRLTAEEKTFVPEMERWKVFLVARIYLAVFAAVIAACLAFRSILPAMYVGLPTLYGGFFVIFFGLTQHAGLAEDVLDHRLNSRTVYMNPLFRFLYWNMNYHVEHHMFPMVPYHALPKLHAAMKHDCPQPYPSCLAAYREIIPALLRQRKDPTWHVERRLPAGAAPMMPPAGIAPAAAE